MADALSDLNALIERVRVEADAAGYARAWRELGKLAADHVAKAEAEELASGATDTLAELSTLPPRAPRGENRRRVSDALATSDKPRAAQEIRRYIEKRDGIELAYSSIQQALSQLEAAGEAVKDDDGKWSRHDAPFLVRAEVEEDEHGGI